MTGPGPWVLFTATCREWWKDNTFRLAAALAFYTIFSLAPVLVVAVEIASLAFSQEEVREQIVSQIQSLVGGRVGGAVSEILAGISQIRGNPLAVAIGIATTFIGSTAVFAELQSGLNQIWDVKTDPNRSALKRLLFSRLRSFGIVLAVGFFLLVSLALSAVLLAAEHYLSGRIPAAPWLWSLANYGSLFLFTALLFALIYRYLPDVKISWKDVSMGAGVTALLFLGGKFLIGLYLGQFAVGSTYGAAGSFAVLLIWVYYSALICLFGAEFTQVYARRYGNRIRPAPHAVRAGQKPEK